MPDNELANSSATALPKTLLAPELESAFWIPSRIGAMSAWWGHVPFAHWLVCALRPGIVVELGTHNGVSFAAFCEAMQRGNIPGRCYAVDTWKGDEHAGYYDESVFQNLSAFHLANYGAFSDLIRLTFDEALSYFADHSIDLLHIDGLHTYGAVSRDFKNWLPKLSNRAVVLLHDTNVREKNFGVWRLWGELRERYPSFEFLHAHGLGVAAVGPAIPGPVAELFRFDPAAANLLRERFSHLGARWETVDLAERQLAAERDCFQAKLAEHVRHVANLEAKLAEHVRHVANLEAKLAEHVRHVANLEADREKQQVNLTTLESQVAKLRQEVVALRTSTSWRVTAPLRRIATLGLTAKAVTTRSNMWLVSDVNRSAKKLTAPPNAELISGEGQSGKGVTNQSEVELISSSGFFDEAYYPGTVDSRAKGLDPIEHYLGEGEAAGLPPSALFNPVFYRERYNDVKNSGISPLCHYIRSGKGEGRSPRAAADSLTYPANCLSLDRETVLVAVHEATRTGAPLLALNIVRELGNWYNVVILLKRDGPIRRAFTASSCAVVALPDTFVVHDCELKALTSQLMRRYAPRYVIANSAETRYFVPSFERAGTPVIALIHEFSSTVRPRGTLEDLFKSASQVVFSAGIVAQSALEEYRALEARTHRVLTQGPSVLPPEHEEAGMDENSVIRDISRQLPGADGSILVIGIGTITMRKGVEFFIAAAAAVQRRRPLHKITFAWVGKCYPFDEPYLEYLKEQIRRSGVESSCVFLNELQDLEPVYARADICFLSSRLDPLPNIVIDSAVRGIPVICFDQASGIAEILKKADGTRDLVVPYLDADAAAQRVVELAEDPARRSSLSDAIRAVAVSHFDMTRYVERIDALGREAAQGKIREQRDHLVIARHEAFNADLYLGPLTATMSADEAIAHYLHASSLAAPRDRPWSGMLVRRPLEGFHPLVYAAANPQYDEASGEDPLAHYCRTGKPKGLWQHEIIRPVAGRVAAVASLRVGIHGHFYYPDLLTDFLERLGRNATNAELFLTTSSEDRAQALSEILAKAGVEGAIVSVVPNRGRDIGAMLTALNFRTLNRFDVFGHFHGKRSPHVDTSISDVWRNFLWEHLIGGTYAMMDIVTRAFATDTTLGLVFAEDPHLNGWDENREFADQFAKRMGLRLPLPNHFDFPHGTMFWVRPPALQSLLNLSLKWDDYPPEPVPIDGTPLHALERLVPFSAAHAGYRYATTYLDISRR